MSDYTGTGSLVRLALRRDRVTLPIWIAAFVLTAASSAKATVGLYPDEGARVQAAHTLNGNTSLVALYGRIYDETSEGALGMIKMGGIGAAFIAVFAILLTVRHTRAEEEAGRLDLVGAAVVGRRAPLTAALIVSVGANLVLGILTALALAGAGLPVDGSFAFGFAWAGVGVAFAAVAAVFAQVTSGARAANGFSFAFLGLVYLLRAAGDVAKDGPNWLTWLSPIGWGQQFRPYAGNRWWVLLLTAAFAIVVTGVAYGLVARRDLGAGLVAERPGPAQASPALRGPLSLAWRLQRGSLLAWTAGFLFAGLVFGNIADQVGGFMGSDQARDFMSKLGGEKGLTEAYLATMLGIMGVIASAYGVSAAMRLRSEETAQRAEPVLATATSRRSWVLSHMVVALAGTAVLMMALGLAAGFVYGLKTGDVGRMWGVVGGALVQVPAAWVLTGLVVLGFGFAPRLALTGWVFLVAFVLLGELGPLFELNQRVMDVSPFAHVPLLPGGSVSAVPLLTMVLLTFVLAAGGLLAFRRRDVPGA
jgi:ABC-2 type transport system permease protein